MKTERFDEEFRRKLLGLPAEADPGEVERIQGFVKANKPALPGLGWGKLWLYGGSSLLLIGSLSYNVLQTYRNTHLQVSIDSLAYQSVMQATTSHVIRHDTVYVTRPGDTEGIGSASTRPAEPAGKGPLVQVNTSQSVETGRKGSVATGKTKSPPSGHETSSSQPAGSSPRSSLQSNTLVATAGSTGPNQRTEKSSQVRAQVDSSVVPSPITSGDRLLVERANSTSKTERKNKPIPAALKTVDSAYSTANLSTPIRSKNRRGNKDRQPIPSSDRTDLFITNPSGKQDQRTDSNPSPVGLMSANTESSRSAASITELNRQAMPVDPLTSRQRIPPTQWAILSPNRPLIIPINGLPAKAIRQAGHLTAPGVSVPTVQYRIGAGLAGGNDQVGGSLLGEVMLNVRWSVQSGLRAGYGQGFHYRDEQDFKDHQHADFRQTYASQVSSLSAIEDIKQMSLLLQVPLQVAYHLPLGRQWGLRLGAGTDLDVWVRSAIRYDYRENSRSSEHGSLQIKEPVHIFNNFTLSTAVERSWKKWLFRAGPFIRPQLRPVGYKPDDLSWGANFQVLYRVGK